MGSKHRLAPEVKADIVRRIKEEGVTVQQAAKEHGVHETTVYGWLGGGATGAPTFGEVSKLRKENNEYIRIIGELTVRLSTAQKKNW
jgi:transposase-like protein